MVKGMSTPKVPSSAAHGPKRVLPERSDLILCAIGRIWVPSPIHHAMKNYICRITRRGAIRGRPPLPIETESPLRIEHAVRAGRTTLDQEARPFSSFPEEDGSSRVPPRPNPVERPYFGGCCTANLSSDQWIEDRPWTADGPSTLQGI